MNYLTWQKVNEDIAKFIELFVLPNTLAFALAKLYFDSIEIDDSYEVFYNTIRTLFNIIDEDKKLVFKIMSQILYVKYGLIYENTNPIKLKKIN
ncbi:MAG: hypothetical protein K2G03_02915 [Bacilli bacterium]|nr:hypothetical protein [Bacilli bacterium]